MVKNVLEVTNLSYLYPSGKGAHKISFSVQEGDFVVIAGPNGAGKSTLLKLLVGSLKAQQGEVSLNQRNLQTLSRREFAKEVAYITQSPSGGSMSLLEYISLGYYVTLPKGRFWLTKAEKIYIEEMMSVVGLTTPLNQNISQLSGGERQLAQICRALLQNPKLLFMDEPVAHLDLGHAITVLDLVDRLRKERGITVLTVLHEINLASDYATKMLFLKEGELLAHDTPQKLLTSAFLSPLFEVEISVELKKSTQKPAIFPVPQKFR